MKRRDGCNPGWIDWTPIVNQFSIKKIKHFYPKYQNLRIRGCKIKHRTNFLIEVIFRDHIGKKGRIILENTFERYWAFLIWKMVSIFNRDAHFKNKHGPQRHYISYIIGSAGCCTRGLQFRYFYINKLVSS